MRHEMAYSSTRAQTKLVPIRAQTHAVTRARLSEIPCSRHQSLNASLHLPSWYDVNKYWPTLVALFLISTCLRAWAASPPLLVVMRPTGQERDGVPVLEQHPDGKPVTDALLRGFSGRLLRLFALQQEFLRQKTGRVPEPAYLALSDRQGGFPRFGFWLDDEWKPDTGWVDLHRGLSLTGRFGAMDQIFPHELVHVILHQLAGEPRTSGANQVHAVSIRTDPVIAFNEGFAEHVQILAIDDPDAAAETQALAVDEETLRRAQSAFARYARDLNARLPLVRPSQMRFLLWYSANEQVLRYHAVKANSLARVTVVPERLLAKSDKYTAYLYHSTVLAAVDAPAKPASVLLSTEGVVSHLFWRWVTDDALQRRLCDESFYAQYATTRSGVVPWENVYLKLFHALYAGKPSDTAELIRAYVREFPEDAADVQRLVRETLLGQSLPEAPEIWLANTVLQTGTSLFDQYRALPRVHTFDSNAATPFDWLTVPGVTPDTAAQLVAGAPYRTLDDLLAECEADTALRQRVTEMARAMDDVLGAEGDESLSLSTILWSYVWRLAAILAAATVAGAWVARRAGAKRWWTAALIALAASFIVVTLAWIVTCPPWYPLAAPLVLGGVPWGLWRLVRQRQWRPALAALVVWIVAMLPAVILTRAAW